MCLFSVLECLTFPYTFRVLQLFLCFKYNCWTFVIPTLLCFLCVFGHLWLSSVNSGSVRAFERTRVGLPVHVIPTWSVVMHTSSCEDLQKVGISQNQPNPLHNPRSWGRAWFMTGTHDLRDPEACPSCTAIPPGDEKARWPTTMAC